MAAESNGGSIRAHYLRTNIWKHIWEYSVGNKSFVYIEKVLGLRTWIQLIKMRATTKVLGENFCEK